MNGGDGYVWDRSGPVDAQVAYLEAALSGLKHSRSEPGLVIGPRAELRLAELRFVEPARPVPTIRRERRWLSAAALVAMAVIAGWFARPAMGPWLKIESRSGAPMIGSREAGGKLPVGQWLKTDHESSAAIAVASLGTVTVHPNSKIRVRHTDRHEHRLEMPYGSIHAFITAPPRVFIVDTPAARAVDMGCEYTLDVDEHGSGILRVSLGHVLLEGHGKTSDVPMLGGACRIMRGFGPGTPFFDDASTLFIEALDEFDFRAGGDAALQTVIAEARPKDALSLWHLLSRTSGAARERILARLEALKPRSDEISREGLLRLEPGALEAYWNHMRPF